MDSLFSFTPLYESADVMQMPIEDIEEIRVRILNIFLARHKGKRPPYPSLSRVIVEVIEALRVLLEDKESPNTLLKRLHDVGHELHIHPRTVVQAALSTWYRSAIPAVSRDPLHGHRDGEPLHEDQNGNVSAVWNREYARRKHKIANLGIVAMLMTIERWQPENHPLLEAGSLISRTTTTLIYACFLISAQLSDEAWKDANKIVRPHEALRLFIKSSWAVSREGFAKMDCPTPGIQYGATLDEARLTMDCKQLITNIGQRGWSVAPLDHPLRMVPGSAWNKFLRNHFEPIFPESPTETPRFQVKIPSTVLEILAPIELFYQQLQNRFDSTDERIRILAPEDAAAQYVAFSEATGSPYPGFELSENNATSIETPSQDYLYRLPLIRMPMTDLRGHLTFPFMNALIRAFDTQDDVDEVVQQFRLLCFEP
ncbi:mating-type MAT1-1-2 [Purpureocillium lavendulum]|uniref:Mating-type MAT1-1-2 n=1 Tax=Purpureocillium lavendulum TaxID=1247861 RepID=A0AB34FYG2_9HYPO|nr:mating-type MAT1-1-2 [Purpureocillium lavendulum]